MGPPIYACRRIANLKRQWLSGPVGHVGHVGHLPLFAPTCRRRSELGKAIPSLTTVIAMIDNAWSSCQIMQNVFKDFAEVGILFIRRYKYSSTFS